MSEDETNARRLALPGRRSMIWAAVLVVLLAGVGVGAYFIGASAADDSDKVAELERELADARGAHEEMSSRASALQSEIDVLEEEKSELSDRLDAERNISGKDSSRGASGSAPVGDLEIGQAATVGEYSVKPTSVQPRGNGYRATLTVKNDGSESDSPFCGGGATLIDEDGRSFDGEAVIDESSDACDDLQPGLTGTIVIDFTTPDDADAAALELQPDVLNEGDSKTWNVG